MSQNLQLFYKLLLSFQYPQPQKNEFKASKNIENLSKNSF